MCARSIRFRHAFVRGLILLSFLLLPWPVLAEEEAVLPLSKIVLYSSGVEYFQHDGMVNNRSQLDLVKKLDQQEIELENLRKEIERLKNVEEEHRRELQNYVMNLEVT
jgi:hypothetical protein